MERVQFMNSCAGHIIAEFDYDSSCGVARVYSVDFQCNLRVTFGIISGDRSLVRKWYDNKIAKLSRINEGGWGYYGYSHDRGVVLARYDSSSEDEYMGIPIPGSGGLEYIGLDNNLNLTVTL